MTIGSWLTEDNRAGLDSWGKPGSITGHTLAIRLHIELLDVSRESKESLAVGKNSSTAIVAHIVVIESDKTQENWDVFRSILGVEEMLIN